MRYTTALYMARESSSQYIYANLLQASDKTSLATSEGVRFVYDGGLIYTSFKLPPRDRRAILNLELSFDTHGEYKVSNATGNIVKLPVAREQRAVDLFLNPGVQNHLYDQLELHRQYLLPKTEAEVSIAFPLVNDNYDFYFAIAMVIQEYVITVSDGVDDSDVCSTSPDVVPVESGSCVLT